jgi:hypothetical protein
MISDEDLLLYHYRELDDAERARIGAALAGQPELARRLHTLVARLDAAAAMPEVPVPEATQQRWLAALQSAATETRAKPAPRRFSGPRLLQWAAAAMLVLALVVTFQVMQPPPQPIATNPTPGPAPETPDATDASAYENGLKFHLASTERRLASLGSATPEERARMIEAIIGQNRIYALAAERAGEPQLARVLRAFTPILESLAREDADAAASAVSQLGFELRVMQSRLGADAKPTI